MERGFSVTVSGFSLVCGQEVFVQWMNNGLRLVSLFESLYSVHGVFILRNVL